MKGPGSRSNRCVPKETARCSGQEWFLSRKAPRASHGTRVVVVEEAARLCPLAAGPGC